MQGSWRGRMQGSWGARRGWSLKREQEMMQNGKMTGIPAFGFILPVERSKTMSITEKEKIAKDLS